MSTIKNANGWTDTNSIEAHLRREGRIVGKIIRGFKHVQGPDGIWLDKPLPWVCQTCCPRLRVIGHRRDKSAAKQLVERALA